MDTDFYGQPVKSIGNEHLRLDFLTSSGPRLVRLVLAGSDQNQLIELPEKILDTPYGDFWMHGGHRLWHAPEAFPRTYHPDTAGVTVEEFSGGVRLTGETEAATGIRKSIEIQVHPGQPAVSLRHILQNQGIWPVELAAWGITMLPLGGVMILPQQVGPLGGDDLLPNRQIVLWPYASWNDPRLHLRDDYVFIEAQPKLPPLKLGYLNRLGWIGYLRKDILFRKRFDPQVDRSFVDFGCNVETYINDNFIEMETVGPLTRLEPGQSLAHTETWEFSQRLETPPSLDEIPGILS